MSKTHPANQSHGGIAADRKTAFRTRIKADLNPMSVPHDCSCTWVIHNGERELKYTDVKCPHHGKFHDM